MDIRPAKKEDLEHIVSLLHDDPLGSTRERSDALLSDSYTSAFEAIENDSNQELMVLTGSGDQIIGTFQLSFIPNLTYQGGWRAQIEGVRVHKSYRGQGLGQKMILWAIERAKFKNARLVQLTTDKKRPEAIEFYESLGFKSSHEGMKYHLI